jgi:D-alanine-D-alanine ligase
VLPIAEMCFDYPADKPRILGYRAKWDTESFEYQHTQRRFLAADQDVDLQRRLIDIGKKCWSVFGLKGYARIDFRVDSSGQVFVLEMNANPCISDDSGFVAAAIQGGLTQQQLIQRIIDAV